MKTNDFYSKLSKVGSVLFLIGVGLLLVELIIVNSPIAGTDFYIYAVTVSCGLMLAGVLMIGHK